MLVIGTDSLGAEGIAYTIDSKVFKFYFASPSPELGLEQDPVIIS